jgi:hypothetical protein
MRGGKNFVWRVPFGKSYQQFFRGGMCMRKLFGALGFALFACLLFTLRISAAETACSFHANNGSFIELDAQSLEEGLGLQRGRLAGLTVVSLPDPLLGRLFCEGVEVECYDYLSRGALDWLVYEPFFDESAAQLTLLPDATGASYGVIALLSTDQPSLLSLTVSVDLLAWRQAQNRYWAHAYALIPDLPV